MNMSMHECVKVEMKKSGDWKRYGPEFGNQIAKAVADLLQYEFERFSSSGCRKVESRLQQYLGKHKVDD